MAPKGLSETPVTENMELLKNYSRVAGLIVSASLLTAIALPAKAESEQYYVDSFYDAVVTTLHATPHYKGDEIGAAIFRVLSPEQKIEFYNLGKRYCENHYKGADDHAMMDNAIKIANDQPLSREQKDGLISLSLASFVAARHVLCP